MKAYSRSTRFRIHRGRSILDRLDGLGIEPPAEVATAAALLDALESRRRALPDEHALRARTVEALMGDPAADVLDLALAEHARDVEARALAEAQDRASEALSHAVFHASDEIVAAARREVFEPSVKILTTVAQLPGGTSLSDLVRSKATKDAEAMTQAPVAAEKVKLCLTLRDSLAHGEAARLPHRVWRHPEVIDWTGHENDVGMARLVHGIRQGGEPHLGTFSEIEDLAREADRARRAAVRAQFAAA